MGQLGDLSPQASVAVGIFVGLVSTSIQSLGLTLQRKSHLIEDAKDIPEARRPPYKRRKWQIGMAMFVVSNLVGSTIQITTLPLPVLSTLQASGLVFNTAFATLLLKEPFTRFSIIGTILTCAGAALIATFGAIGEPAHNLQQLLELLRRRQFIGWMIGTMLVVVATIALAHVLKLWSSRKHLEKQLGEVGGLRSSSVSANISTIRRSFTAQLPAQLQIKVGQMRLFRGLCFALVSGILSAHSLLFAKSAVELLVRTIVDHNNQFNRFQSWLILLTLLFFALSQLYYLHLGLRLCSTSVLYPFVFCVYNIIAILDGLIYFNQASRLTGLHAGLVAVGTVILLTGVVALSWRLDDSIPSDQSTKPRPASTPLTPGLGIIPNPDDMESEPLFPTGRPRSSTATPKFTMEDEETPLLFHHRSRAPTLSIFRPPPEPDSNDIWAELEDDNDDQDIVASLPRASSPFLSHRRRRGDSNVSQALSTSPSENETHKHPYQNRNDSRSPRRAQTLQAKAKAANGGMRRSSAPHSKRDVVMDERLVASTEDLHSRPATAEGVTGGNLKDRLSATPSTSSLHSVDRHGGLKTSKGKGRVRSSSAGVRWADDNIPRSTAPGSGAVEDHDPHRDVRLPSRFDFGRAADARRRNKTVVDSEGGSDVQERQERKKDGEREGDAGAR